MLTAANKNFRSIGGYFTNFYRSASSVDSVSQEIYSQQAFYIYYTLNELLGTKLRALYQRKKGRDLFDLAIALDNEEANPKKVVASFYTYMEHRGHKVTRTRFQENIAAKLNDKNFTSDIGPLLASGYAWDHIAMSKKVNDSLISLLSD